MKLGAPIELTEEEIGTFGTPAPTSQGRLGDPLEVSAEERAAAQPVLAPPIDPLDDFDVFNAIEDQKEATGYNPDDPGVATKMWEAVKGIGAEAVEAGKGVGTLMRGMTPGGGPEAEALLGQTAGKALSNYKILGEGTAALGKKAVAGAVALLHPEREQQMKRLSREATWNFLREAREADQFTDNFNQHLETIFPEALAGFGSIPVDNKQAGALTMVLDPANIVPAGTAARWTVQAPLRGAVRAANATLKEASLAYAEAIAKRESISLALKPGLSAGERGPLFARYQAADAAAQAAKATKEVATKVLVRTTGEQRAIVDQIATEAASQPLVTRAAALIAQGAGRGGEVAGRAIQQVAAFPEKVANFVASGADASAREGIATGIRNVAGAFGALPAVSGATGVAVANAGRNLKVFGQLLAQAEGQLPFFKQLARETDGLARFSASMVDQSGLGSLIVPTARLATEASRGLPLAAGMSYAGSAGDTDATLKGATGGMVFGLAGASYGQWRRFATGALQRQQRIADIARYRSTIASDDARSHYDALPGADRAALATMQLAHPDLTIKYEDLGAGRPSFYYAAEDGPVAVVNLATRDGIGAVVAHEVGHHIERHNLGPAVERVLFGDPLLERPGLFTEIDAAGAPVLTPEGDYARNQAWAKLKESYNARLKAHADRTGEVIPPRDDAAMAREVFSEHAADYLLGRNGTLQRDLRSTVWSPAIETMASALVGSVPGMRGLIGKLGVPLASDRSIVGSELFPGGLPASKDLTRLLRDYTKRSARGISTPLDDEPGNTRYTVAEVTQHPEILDRLFDGSDDVARDARGRVLRDKAGKPRFLTPKEQKAQRAALASALDDEVSGAAMPGARFEEGGKDGSGWAIPALPDPLIDKLAASGKFNPVQLEHLRQASALIRAGEGESALFFYQPAMNAKKQYAGISGDWRTETPYQIFISKAGNVLLRTMSREKLMANAQEMIARKRAAAWNNELPALVKDIDTYLSNHAAGRPGADGIGVEKRDQINYLFGINTKTNAGANPFLESAPKAPVVIRSRRLDRLNRLTVVDEKFSTNYELLNRNFRPEGAVPPMPAGIERLASALPASIERAGGSTQAANAAKRFLNQPISNLQTGITATISGGSLRKMLSASAALRSVSPEAHNTAVANLDRLFPLALQAAETRPDRRGNANLQAVHRFDAPLPIGANTYRVKMLLKEFTQPGQGTRIYTVEALEIGKPASYGGDANTGETGSTSLPPAGFDSQFAELASLVNPSSGRKTAKPKPESKSLRVGADGISAPSTPAERDALPPGTQYRAPDGSIRIR